jgi:hypothetical protein
MLVGCGTKEATAAEASEPLAQEARAAESPSSRLRGTCIPKPLPERLLANFLITQPEHEERAIRRYVEIQAKPEKVTHLEKIKTERLRTRAMDAWDVRSGESDFLGSGVVVGRK